MYPHNHYYMDDQQPEDRPVLPSISRIFDSSGHPNARTSSSMRLPPLPRNGQPQYIQPIRSTTRPETWPQFPLPDSQYQSSRTAAPIQNYPVRIRMIESPRDPHISAFETNQAMDALADARSSRSRQYSHNTFDLYNQREQAEYSSRSSGGSDTRTPDYPRNYEMHDSSAVYPRSTFDRRVADSSSSMRHQCGYCGKRFSRPSGLKIHITTHTGEKPYICPEEGCHRSFSVRSNMRRHVRIVHQMSGSLEGTSDSSEEGDARDSREGE